MAKSTFSGPVRSLAGFISAGSSVVVSLTADTTLTVRYLLVMTQTVNLLYLQLLQQLLLIQLILIKQIT